jgi:hypothetical protein
MRVCSAATWAMYEGVEPIDIGRHRRRHFEPRRVRHRHSLTGQVAGSGASESAAKRVEQQAAVAALRHRDSQPYETHGLIAQVVGLPAAFGQAGGAE